jgi:PPOX class probable F420-dependent enzyme
VTAGPLVDESPSFGARVARHLRDDVVVWLTTVSPSGTPTPSVVWFLWDGDRGVLVYSRQTSRIANIARNPKVSLNFAGDGVGGDVAVVTGEARVDRSAPRADEVPAYLEKYGARIGGGLDLSPGAFASRYHTAIRITLTRLRGH